ncbi:MAG: hypothetical protein ACK4OM_04675 [Alphaproteobacteria bacterium]
MNNSNHKLSIHLDENKNFKLEISYFIDTFEVEINITSYANSNNNFAKYFAKNLKLKTLAKTYSVKKTPFKVPLENIYQKISLFYNNTEYLVFEFIDNSIKIIKQFRQLVVFETRLIGRYQGNYIPLSYNEELSLSTDLHTHLSGQVSASSLIEIGIKHNILYPVSFFEQQKIEYKRDNLQLINKRRFLPTSHINANLDYESAIPFSDLTLQHLELLKSSLSLSSEAQSTFEDIENCYKLREPFTKNIDLLEDIFISIAKDYKANGVKYAELSSNSIIDTLWLDKIENILPAVEKKYGVIFRFLVGIPRNLTKQDLRKRITKIKSIYKNPYITGIDLLGYEINKTSHLESKLNLLAEHIKNDRKDFVFRIHAGENSKNPNNVKEALLFAIEHKIKMRIGHALHGIDEETIDLASKLSRHNLITIEFNPDSNLASNNIDFPEDIPFKKFINAGVKCVLSSDGAGLYQTSGKQTAIAGKICGLGLSDFEFITQVEKEYVEYASTYEIFDIEKALNASNYSANDIHSENINHLIIDKTPIFIAGSTGSSWLEISKQKRNDIKKLLKKLIYSLDPNKVFFVTGRSKDKGIDVELGKIITLYNFEHNKNFLFISLISEVSEENTIKPRGISYISDFSTPLVYLPSETISYIKSRNGIAIFIGGKSFTRDFIVEADKQNITYALMDEIPGASNEKARVYQDKSFNNFEDLFKIIKCSQIDLQK